MTDGELKAKDASAFMKEIIKQDFTSGIKNVFKYGSLFHLAEVFLELIFNNPYNCKLWKFDIHDI